MPTHCPFSIRLAYPHKQTQVWTYCFSTFLQFNQPLLAEVSASFVAKYIRKKAIDLSHLLLSFCLSVHLPLFPSGQIALSCWLYPHKVTTPLHRSLSFKPMPTRANAQSCQAGWVRCVQAIGLNRVASISGTEREKSEKEREREGLKQWVLRDWTHSYWSRTFCPRAQHKTMHDGRKWPSVSGHNSAWGKDTITHTHPADDFLGVCVQQNRDGMMDGWSRWRDGGGKIITGKSKSLRLCRVAKLVYQKSQACLFCL